MKTRNEKIKLSQITNKFDVRTQLDEDRVLQFAGMYESGEELPPVKVVQTSEGSYAYVDGRTRGAARAFLGLEDIDAIVLNDSLEENPVELFAQALEANWGGAKPPTRTDLIHTVTRMLEHGASQTAIRERLKFVAPGSLKAYISSARSTIMKRRIAKGMESIRQGKTVDEAAKRAGIQPSVLKDLLGGKKSRWGAGKEEDEIVTAMKNYISKELRSVNSGISKKIQFLLEKVDAGEVSAAKAGTVIKAWKDHLRHTNVRIEDWQARLNALNGEQEKATEHVA